MAKKKKQQPAVQKATVKPWCYYCNKKYATESLLIAHQKEKHFKCEVCGKKLTSAAGMKSHNQMVHNREVTKVPNAIEGRDDFTHEIYGMSGVPKELLSPEELAVFGEQDDAAAMPVMYPPMMPGYMMQPMHPMVPMGMHYPPAPMRYPPMMPGYMMPQMPPGQVPIPVAPHIPVVPVAPPPPPPPPDAATDAPTATTMSAAQPAAVPHTYSAAPQTDTTAPAPTPAPVTPVPAPAAATASTTPAEVKAPQN